MNIRFIGIGSAFNTKLGNTSAYQKKKQSLFLIDCGSLVFHQLKEQEIIQDLKKIYVVITHTHPDHVASLAELIFYSYYILKIKIEVVFPDEKQIRRLLNLVGATAEMYYLHAERTLQIKDEALGVIEVTSVEAHHTESMPAFSLYIKNEEGRIFYSGDCTDLREGVVTELEQGMLERAYQDTCSSDYEGNLHCYIGKLEKQVPPHLRHKVYCMHLDEKLTPEKIREKGFEVVTRHVYKANEASAY